MAMGARIREARERAGLSLAELAEKTDLLQTWLDSYESGRATPRSSHLIRLAEALSCSILDFLPGEPLRSERIYPGWEEREARWRQEHPE